MLLNDDYDIDIFLTATAGIFGSFKAQINGFE